MVPSQCGRWRADPINAPYRRDRRETVKLWPNFSGIHEKWWWPLNLRFQVPFLQKLRKQMVFASEIYMLQIVQIRILVLLLSDILTLLSMKTRNVFIECDWFCFCLCLNDWGPTMGENHYLHFDFPTIDILMSWKNRPSPSLIQALWTILLAQVRVPGSRVGFACQECWTWQCITIQECYIIWYSVAQN